MSQFYALIKDEEGLKVRLIDLAEDIVESTKEIFINAARELLSDGTEAVEFDGQYVIREEDDEIAYITMPLPESFADVPQNQQGITLLDIEHDAIKSLFWYEEGEYYFQLFNSANLLENKYIVKYLQEQHTFNRFTEKAFVINNKIQAIYKNGRLYFKSFPSASKIFDLSTYMIDATLQEVTAFGDNNNLDVDVNWLTEHANSKTRRLIKMISESGTLDAFMAMGRRARLKLARNVHVSLTFENEKLKLPRSVSQVNKILEFLNEDVYQGLISSNVYRTNSKRPG